MAKLGLVFSVIIYAILYGGREINASAAPSPSPSEDLSDYQRLKLYYNSLPKDFHDLLERCYEENYNLSRQCGIEFMAAIYSSEQVSNPCCKVLTKLGLQCHNGLTKFMADMPWLKSDEQSKIIANGAAVWKSCASKI